MHWLISTQVVAVSQKSRLYGVVCVGDALQGVDGVEFSNLDQLLATLEYKAASTKRLTFARGDREPPPPRPHAVEKVYETVDVVVGAKLCGNENFTARSC